MFTSMHEWNSDHIQSSFDYRVKLVKVRTVLWVISSRYAHDPVMLIRQQTRYDYDVSSDKILVGKSRGIENPAPLLA